MTFSPQLKPIKRIVKDLQGILNVDPTLKAIFPNQPLILIAYRQPHNLRNLLTSRKLPDISEEVGTFPCQHTRCQVCPYIYTTDPNVFTHRISGRFQCSSTNVIYAI